MFGFLFAPVTVFFEGKFVGVVDFVAFGQIVLGTAFFTEESD